MRQFSREVYFHFNRTEIPIKKVFRIEAQNKIKAEEILDTMIEIYSKKLKGRKPIEDASRMKSIPKVKPSEVSDRTIKMLQGIFKTKKH